MGPTTPLWQRRQALTPQRFGLIPFRSPLLRDSLFVFFSSGYLDVSVHPVPSTGPMYSDLGTSALPLVGFPIRTSSDQGLFGASPRLFAACHVLRRLLAPRHPPYALISLALMLALAMEFPRFKRFERPASSYSQGPKKPAGPSSEPAGCMRRCVKR